jgi:hypothetical protein
MHASTESLFWFFRSLRSRAFRRSLNLLHRFLAANQLASLITFTGVLHNHHKTAFVTRILFTFFLDQKITF